MTNQPNVVLSRTLKIIQINVNSIISISKRYSLNKFIELHKPDIVLLSETKLNKRHKLCITDYNVVRNDRPNSRGGGIAILIRNDISHKEIVRHSFQDSQILEISIISIPMGNNKTLFVISAYYPAGNNSSGFETDLTQVFVDLNIQDLDNFYILGGDLNSKRTEWGNTHNNTKGNALKNWLSENEMTFRCKLYASSTASYPRTESFLDLFIIDSRIRVNSENDTLNCIETLPYDSDHEALILTASMTNNQLFDLFKAIPEAKYNYKSTNWNKFQKSVTNKTDDKLIVPNHYNLTNSEIDQFLELTNSIIIDSIEEVIPTFRNSKFPISNRMIEKLHKEKSRLLTIVKRHNRLENSVPEPELLVIKATLKRIRKLIRDNLIIAMNRNFEKNLSAINSKQSADMFSKIRKNFKGIDEVDISELRMPVNSRDIIEKANVDHSVLQLDNDQNYIIRNESDIANTIGAYFQSIHSPKDIDETNSSQLRVMNTFNEFLHSKNTYESNNSTVTTFTEQKRANALTIEQTDSLFVTCDTLLGIFRNLRNKVSYGLDKIPYIVLKNLPDKMKQDYCTIFNNIINNSYYPTAWKKAKVIVIPKKAKTQQILKILDQLVYCLI
ncbi:uncharacterized protein LOC142224578 [Haematobia irritans]|uniref:uncharacterized protein LOC142224578 n=1 Tax=Haematobia irritans TaxID=7368 RepID=UPI003F4FE9C2